MMSRMVLAMLLVTLLSCDKNGGGDGTPPTLSINDVALNEGSAGTTSFTFELTLSKSASKPVTAQYRTVEGTAKANEDFLPVNDQSVTIQPGETKKTISISVVTDEWKESDESFSVRLFNVANATVIRESGFATIRNDDTRLNISNAGGDAPTNYPGYSLVWSDEFDGSSLNTSIWSFETGDGCPNLCGWGNNELQFYTSSAENLFFQDGKMIIQAKQEAYGGRSYTSARIRTAGKKSMKFGRIDIRAILPQGKGIWPAFWLLPQDNVYGGWPRSGELDMMEYLGHETNKVHATVHYGPGPGSTQITRSYNLPSGNFNQQFHVFSLEWVQDEIRWLVDGTLYATVKKSDFGSVNYPFNENFYLLINMAVGGNWPGNPDASTTFPQYLIVDYVRWYQ